MDGRDLSYIKVLGNCFQKLGSFKLTPFEWDGKEMGMKFVENKRDLHIWYFHGLFIPTVVFSYCTVRLVHEIFTPDPSFRGFQLIVYFLYYAVYCLSVVFNATFLFKGKLIAVTTTEFIHLDRILSTLFRDLPRGGGNESNSNVLVTFMQIFILAFCSVVCFIPLGTLTMENIDPIQRFVQDHFLHYQQPSSSFLTKTSTKLLMAFVMFYSSVLIGAGVLSSLLLIMVFVWRSNFWATQIIDIGHCSRQQINFHEEKHLLKISRFLEIPILRGIRLYQMFYLLNTRVNEITYWMSPCVVFVGGGMNILCIYGNVVLLRYFPLPFSLVLPIMSVNLFITAKIVFTYASAQLLNSIEIIRFYSQSDSKYVRMLAKSCKPLSVECGMFFSFVRSTVVTFYRVVVDYAITLILSIKVTL